MILCACLTGYFWTRAQLFHPWLLLNIYFYTHIIKSNLYETHIKVISHIDSYWLNTMNGYLERIYTPLAYMHTHLLADSKNKAFKYKSSEKNQTQKQNEREIETERMDGWMNRGRVSRQKRSENTRRNETNLLIHPYYYDCFYFHFWLLFPSLFNAMHFIYDCCKYKHTRILLWQ